MVLRIGIQESPNHPLVLCIVFPRLAFKKLHASFAQGNGNFDSFIPKNQILRARKKVRNHFQVPERLIRVSDFRVHRWPFPSANTQLQKSGSCRRYR